MKLAAALEFAWLYAWRSTILKSWLFAVHEDQGTVWLQPDSTHWAEAGLRTQCQPVRHFH